MKRKGTSQFHRKDRQEREEHHKDHHVVEPSHLRTYWDESLLGVATLADSGHNTVVAPRLARRLSLLISERTDTVYRQQFPPFLTANEQVRQNRPAPCSAGVPPAPHAITPMGRGRNKRARFLEVQRRRGGAAVLEAQRAVGSTGRDKNWFLERPGDATVAVVGDRRRLRRPRIKPVSKPAMCDVSVPLCGSPCPLWFNCDAFACLAIFAFQLRCLRVRCLGVLATSWLGRRDGAMALRACGSSSCGRESSH